MSNKKWLLFLAIAVIVIIAGLGIIFFASNRVGDKNGSSNGSSNGQVAGVSTQNEDDDYKERLAKYMTEKGMVMYGTSSCGYCQKQKDLFGDAFEYVDYVGCSASDPNANPDECIAREIEGYPTWIYNGQKYPGYMALSKLAEIVGFSE